MFTNTTKSRPRSATDRPTVSSASTASFSTAGVAWSLAVGAMHLRQQPLVPARQFEHAHFPPEHLPRARQALEKPRSIGVEGGDVAHIDGRAGRGHELTRNVLDQRFELGGMACGPRSRRGELQAPVAHDAGQVGRLGQSVLGCRRSRPRCSRPSAHDPFSTGRPLISVNRQTRARKNRGCCSIAVVVGTSTDVDPTGLLSRRRPMW